MNAPVEAGALIPPTFNPALEQALVDRLTRITARGGSFGMVEALAVLLGLIQNSLTPTLAAVDLALVVADHGFAAEPQGQRSTAETLAALRDEQLPLVPLARLHGVAIHVVHASGTATSGARTEQRSLQRVRTTDDARRGAAMSAEQAHAALRLGMRESEHVDGSAIVCAGLGAGSDSGAALVLGALTRRDPADFAAANADASAPVERIREQHAALWKTAAARDPIEVVAALGGFEIATLAGLMLGAAARRRLVLVDGMAALAALQVATRIAPYASDYCVPVRSRGGRGLVAALALCRPALPSAVDIEAMDGTGGVLAVPVCRSAAALLATKTA